MRGVGASALYTAALRAVESERDDALFRDDLASALAGSEGFALLEEMEGPRHGPRSQGVPVRTRFFDDLVAAAATPQIVLLGAGLDTRAFRLELGEDAVVFEVDVEDVLLRKEAILAATDAVPECRRVVVSSDIRGDWPQLLLANGFRVDLATTWVAEGLLGYLREDEVERLIRSCTVMSAPGSHLGFDVVSTDYLTSPATAYGRDVMRKHDAELLSGTDHPHALVEPNGWKAQVRLPGDAAVSHGRLPRSEQLQRIGVPDVFFVHASLG